MQAPISFDVSHLEAVKRTGYKIYDFLCDGVYNVVPGKSEFLNVWGKCLNQSDWQSVVYHAKANTKQSGRVDVITPSTIEKMATTIRTELGDDTISQNDLVLYLLNAATAEEQARFIDDGWEWECLNKTEKPIIRLELGPKKLEEYHLLVFIWGRENVSAIDEEQLTVQFLDYCRRKRKQNVRGYRVWRRQGLTVTHLVESLIAQGYLAREDGAITMSKTVDWLIRSRLTDDFSEEWISWFKSLRKHIDTIPNAKLEEDWKPYIKLFSQGIPAEKAAVVSTWGESGLEAARLLEASFDELNLDRALPIVHINPTLYLARQHMGLRVNRLAFSIACSDAIIEGKVVATKPYPNKRYVTLTQATPIDGVFFNLPSDCNLQTDVVITWQVNDWTIQHTLDLMLEEAATKPDHLYSLPLTTYKAGAQSGYSPVEIMPTAFYDLTDEFKPSQDETLLEAATRSPRHLHNYLSIRADGNKHVELRETIKVAYRPVQAGSWLTL